MRQQRKTKNQEPRPTDMAAKAKKTNDPERQAAEGRMDVADLVRVYEASVKLAVPTTQDLLLRDGAANKLVQYIRTADVTDRQVTRLFEAACDVKFCEDNDDKFRDILAATLVTKHRLSAKPRIPQV